MSQAGIISTSGGTPPPVVATSYVTDVNSPAIPAANILNVLGNDSTSNNSNGIFTDGSSGSNTLTIFLSNRLQGTTSTVGAVTGDVITFALGATPGTYTFDCRISGFNASTPAGVGYTIVGAVRTTGVAATLLASQQVDSFEEASTTACTGTLVVSGNSAIFQVLGAAGLTINWVGVGEYVFSS